MSMFRKLRAGSDSGDVGRQSNPLSRPAETHDSGGDKGLAYPFRSQSEPSQEQSLLMYAQEARKDTRTLTKSDETIASGSSHQSLLSRLTSRDKEPEDPLGLNLIHGSAHSDADIILVHGLGGSSLKSWSWERNTDDFWPAWLRHERGLSQFRVFSYGYNANFRDPDNPLSIMDFSKGLLVRMKTYGDGDTEDIGLRPIIFIAHSMGGLVVKKALVVGKNDDHFSSMLSKVHGIMFLSTPHKGSSHARTLNNFLSVIFGTTKVYVSELESSSTSIEDISEQFRAICSQWQLISLYETLPTKLLSGVRKMIVGKDSGVLNYPQEISAPIDADHHAVCKYDSRLNPNYLLVTNLLRRLTQDLRSQVSVEAKPSVAEDESQILQTIFGIQGNIQEDIDSNLALALPGSCRWLRRRKSFRTWLDASNGAQTILWLTGPPGTGKSILAAKTIDHIQKAIPCQYHFFIAAQQVKRSAAYCLRAMAFQLATTYPAFADKLIQLHKETKFSVALQKFQVIWDTVFEPIVFKMDFGSTLHWVIDGLDEADTPGLLLRHLMQMQPRIPIKLLLLSRPKRELTSLASPRLGSCVTESISIDHTLADIQDYISSVATEVLPRDKALHTYVVEQIASRAEGSFLWTKLAMDSLWDNWHTQADIELAINNVPNDMQVLYQRMLDSVKSQPSRLREIAFRVLTWAACSYRPLTVAELDAALRPEFSGFVNLEETAVQICGQFVRVDRGTISLIHGTARQFLLQKSGEAPMSTGFSIGHDHLASVCLQYLSQPNWRQVLARVPEFRISSDSDRLESLYEEFPFLRYAVQFWAYHVSLADVNEPTLLLHLRLFCNRYILLWIQAVALSSNLHNIPKAAQYLKKWLRRRRKMESDQSSFSSGSRYPSSAETAFLGRWVTDLIRVVAKFGDNLAQSPSTIHRHIPPLCPEASIVATTYYQRDNSLISVSGLSGDSWDDNMARLSIGQDEIASRIRCAGTYVLALISHNGTVVVWHMDTCEELRRICHGEWVTLLETNKTGHLAATGGRFTTRIWDISTGQQLYSIPKYSQTRLLSLSFAQADTELVAGYDDCSVLSYNLESLADSTLLASQGQDSLRNCPRFMVLSPDHSKLAVGFRGRPILVWDMAMQPQSQPRSIIRADDKDRSEHGEDVFNSPEVVRWQPDGSLMYVLYQDATVLVWDLLEDMQAEFGNTEAREMVLNEDGTCLLTSSNGGSISVWGLPKFNLIYRLQSDEFVRDLTFSPDSQRIYDVRGSGCNVWAPDALVRSDELDPDEKMSSADGSILSEAVSEPIFAEDNSKLGRITALACDSEDEFFCCGRDDGSVSIHNIKDGKRARKVSNHSTTVDIIAIDWSLSRRFIASADDSGKIITKRLKIKDDGKWAVYPLFELRVEEAVSQLLFSMDETFLLISTDMTDRVWDLKNKAEVCQRKRQSKTGWKWLNHPNDETQLVWLAPSHLHIHEWASLDRIEPEKLDAPRVQEATKTTIQDGPSIVVTGSVDSQDTVNTIVQPSSRQYLLYEILPGRNLKRGSLARGMRLDLLHVTDLTPASCTSIRRKTLVHLGPEVQHLLGSYRDRIVFLDHDNWVCTCSISWEMGSVQRHYFLPRNWVTDAALRLLLVNRNGTLLCARNGEVAIVRYSKGL